MVKVYRRDYCLPVRGLIFSRATNLTNRTVSPLLERFMATLIDTTIMVTEAPRKKYCLSKANHIEEVSLLLSSPISSYDIEKQDSTTVVVKHRQTLEERIKVRVHICMLSFNQLFQQSTKQTLNAQDEVSTSSLNCWMKFGRAFHVRPLVSGLASVFYSQVICLIFQVNAKKGRQLLKSLRQSWRSWRMKIWMRRLVFRM